MLPKPAHRYDGRGSPERVPRRVKDRHAGKIKSASHPRVLGYSVFKERMSGISAVAPIPKRHRCRSLAGVRHRTFEAARPQAFSAHSLCRRIGRAQLNRVVPGRVL
jgi:hypothetical protein